MHDEIEIKLVYEHYKATTAKAVCVLVVACVVIGWKLSTLNIVGLWDVATAATLGVILISAIGLLAREVWELLFAGEQNVVVDDWGIRGTWHGIPDGGLPWTQVASIRKLKSHVAFVMQDMSWYRSRISILPRIGSYLAIYAYGTPFWIHTKSFGMSSTDELYDLVIGYSGFRPYQHSESMRPLDPSDKNSEPSPCPASNSPGPDSEAGPSSGSPDSPSSAP